MRDHSFVTAGQIVGGIAAAHGAAGDWLTPDLRALIVSTLVGLITAIAREYWGRRDRAAAKADASKPGTGS